MNVLARWVPRRAIPVAADAGQCLAAAAAWLGRAQDAAGCGGVSAYYDVTRHAWAGAYPETTGYVIPTLLRYAAMTGDADCRNRALHMAAWESDIQLDGGGVRAGTMDAEIVAPTIFNTGQVLLGWLAAWRETGVERFATSMRHAADWLVQAQDADGAWRRFGSPFAAHSVNTYNTRVAYALAKVGRALNDPCLVDAAVHNVDWALTRMRRNGWLEDNDLEDNQRPLTHTIAYATRGMLEVGLLADEPRFVDAAVRIAHAVAATQRGDGALPGRLDAQWNPVANWSCVTGNAQMAIVWQRLVERLGETALAGPASRAIAFNQTLQQLHHVDPGIRGGMPGSAPRRGGYMRHRYPNWAAKFFMDALMGQLQGGHDHA